MRKIKHANFQVIFGVAISMIFELNEYYNVTIVNTIQQG